MNNPRARPVFNRPDYYEKCNQALRQAMKDKVLTLVNDRYCNHDYNPSDEEVVSWIHKLESTNNGIARIYLMPNYSKRSSLHDPNGHVTLYNDDAKLSELVFGDPERIGEFTMKFKVLDGKGLTNLSDDDVRRVVASLKSHDEIENMKFDGERSGPVSMFNRSVDASTLFDESNPRFQDPLFGTVYVDERQALIARLLKKRDGCDWTPCLGGFGSHSINLCYSSEDVSIVVHSGAPKSSRELYAIAKHYAAKYTNDPKNPDMTLKEFVSDYPWYKLHLENSSRNCRRLAHKFATALNLKISIQEDRKAVNGPVYMGVPSHWQATNVLESLPHITDLDRYEEYLGVLAESSNNSRLEYLDSKKYMNEDNSQKTLVFFDMCVPNALYNEFDGGMIQKIASRANTGLLAHDGLSSKIEGRKLSDHVYGHASCSYTIQSKLVGSDVDTSVSLDDRDLNQTFLVLDNPDNGIYELDITNDREFNPAFLAFPFCSIKKSQNNLRRLEDEDYEPLTYSGDDRIRTEYPDGKRKSKLDMLGIKSEEVVIIRKRKKSEYPPTKHLFNGYSEYELPERLSNPNGVYEQYKDLVLPLLKFMGYYLPKKLPLQGKQTRSDNKFTTAIITRLSSFIALHSRSIVNGAKRIQKEEVVTTKLESPILPPQVEQSQRLLEPDLPQAVPEVPIVPEVPVEMIQRSAQRSSRKFDWL